MSFAEVKHNLKVEVLRPLRRARALAAYKRLSFAGVPVVFGNAMPKSGSKLLMQILKELRRVGPFVDSGRGPVRTITIHGRTRSTAEILADLARLKPGDFSLGYLNATPENIDFLCRPDWAAYFLIRDPRDMLVSHVFYATEMYAGHGMHAYYNQLPGMDERLKVAIQGIRQPGAQLPDVKERYRRVEGWLDRPEILPIRFEELVLQTEKTLDSILQRLEQAGYRPVTGRLEAIRILAAATDPKRSPTFRKGQVGGWREHFSTENKRLFKDTTGDLLVRLGYEKDNDW